MQIKKTPQSLDTYKPIVLLRAGRELCCVQSRTQPMPFHVGQAGLCRLPLPLIFVLIIFAIGKKMQTQ